MSTDKKQSRFKKYTAEYLEKGLFLPAVILALIAITVIAVEISLGFNTEIFKRKSLLIGAGIVALIVFVYFYAHALKGKVSMVDSGISACILTCIFAIIYMYIKGYGITTLAVIAGGLLLLIVAKIIAIAKHGTAKDKKNSDKKCYISAVDEKYSFFNILILTALILGGALLYLFKIFALTSLFENWLYILICALPFIVYLIFGVGDKRINLGDALILALDISIPILFAFLYLLGYSGTDLKIRVVGGLVAAVFAVVFTIIRIVRYDPKNQILPETDKSKSAIAYYFGKMHEKYSILSYIGLGSLLCIMSLFVFRYTSFIDLLTSSTGDKISNPDLILVILQLAIYSVIGYCGIVSVVNLVSKKVTYADPLLITCLTYAVCALVSFVCEMSKKGIIIIPCGIALLLIVMILRIKRVASHK